MPATGDQTTAAIRRRHAGQRLVIGFDGPAVSADLRALVREIGPGGTILFARNVVEPGQVAALNAALRDLLPRTAPPLRMVDQEGGRVQRLRDPATAWPPMRTVGRHGNATAAVACALAAELRATGFDLDLAPVADVDSNPDNPVIGDRAFASDPEAVASHVAAFVPAMQQAGVLACAKHFPGHGDTHVDSHLDLPVLLTDPATLRARELRPFAAAVGAGVAAVMSAHVVYAALDPHRPATLSEHVIPPLLRDHLGFDGLVLSDDLEMGAIDGRWGPDEIATLATRAGVDLLLMCHDANKQMALYEALIRAQERDPGIARASARSVARLDAARARLASRDLPPPDPSVVGCAAHRALAERVIREGVA